MYLRIKSESNPNQIRIKSESQRDLFQDFSSVVNDKDAKDGTDLFAILNPGSPGIYTLVLTRATDMVSRKKYVKARIEKDESHSFNVLAGFFHPEKLIIDKWLFASWRRLFSRFCRTPSVCRTPSGRI